MDLHHKGKESEAQMKREAIFSDDRVYRYSLSITDDGYLFPRENESKKDTVNFIMLNPSTADEVQNDPTVERCWQRTKAMGFKRLIVTNIFALRSTDPALLYHHPDPVGPENNAWILNEAARSDLIICAWGNHGQHRLRSHAVKIMLHWRDDRVLHVLGLTAIGEPVHPLYQPYSINPTIWQESKAS
jgi:hypothetical protein